MLFLDLFELGGLALELLIVLLLFSPPFLAAELAL
jgi:hypothetical protein